MSQQTEVPKSKKRHPLFGIANGLMVTPPTTDLTAPADPEWADMSDAIEASQPTGKKPVSQGRV